MDDRTLLSRRKLLHYLAATGVIAADVANDSSYTRLAGTSLDLARRDLVVGTLASARGPLFTGASSVVSSYSLCRS